MADRQVPNIPRYKGENEHLSRILDKIKQAIDHIVNTDFVTEKDIYCRDLITSTASIYIGEKKPTNKLDIVRGKLRFAQENMATDKETIKLIKKQAKEIERLEKKIDDLTKKIEV